MHIIPKLELFQGVFINDKNVHFLGIILSKKIMIQNVSLIIRKNMEQILQIICEYLVMCKK